MKYDFALPQGVDLLTKQFADLALRSKNISGNYHDASGFSTPIEFSNIFPIPVPYPADGTEGMSALVNVLPSTRFEIASLMEGFRYGAVGFVFPYNPNLSLRPDYEHLLDNIEETLRLRADRLALLFALLASGVFYGACHRLGGVWMPRMLPEEIKRADIFSKCVYELSVVKPVVINDITVTAALQALRSACFWSGQHLRPSKQ